MRTNPSGKCRTPGPMTCSSAVTCATSGSTARPASRASAVLPVAVPLDMGVEEACMCAIMPTVSGLLGCIPMGTWCCMGDCCGGIIASMLAAPPMCGMPASVACSP